NNSTIFPLRHYGSDPGSAERDGTFRGSDDPVCYRYGWNEDYLDLSYLPAAQIPLFPVYILSRIMDRYDPFAGGMFLVCAEAVSAPFENGRGGSIKIYVTDFARAHKINGAICGGGR